jgi:antitoxin (DNA-binding transcriptional repressor) of toxin-antitoxin stability system
MVKNTPIRRLFPQKKRRNRAEARSQIVEKNPAKRFFDSLKKRLK